MKCRTQLGIAIGASILGLATAALAPNLYGGGGDEGIDILPLLGNGIAGDGAGGAGGEDGPDDTEPPQNGYLTIHGDDVKLDANDSPYASGLIVSAHTRADIFFGDPGEEPAGEGFTSLDILGADGSTIFFSDVGHPSGAGALNSFVHFAGRFQLEDLDEDDAEKLELAGKKRSPAVLGIVVGERATHTGGILRSFKRIHDFLVVSLPSGAVDLEVARMHAKDNLQGSGLDVALVLFSPGPRGADQVWAAFNVDDARAIYDVEVKLR